MKKNINKEDLILFIKESKSIAEVCRKMNLIPDGNNSRIIKNKINLWNIDTTHFTGKAWNTGLRFKPFGYKIPIEEILIENSTYSNFDRLKKRLISENFKTHLCEKCGNNKWLNEIIPLELHHKNGIKTDNRIKNLELLCPNCHTFTDNYCGKNIGNKKNNFIKSLSIDRNNIDIIEKKCKECDNLFIPKKINQLYCSINCYYKNNKKNENFCKCGKLIKTESKMCVECYAKSLQRVKRPDINTLKIEIKELGYSATGKKYGVSDNAIRKWIKN
jgi:hypothetical protein